MIADDRKGRNNERGFYRYENGKKKDVDESVYSVLGVTPSASMPSAEIEDRLSMQLINEAARCLEDGILRSARDGDIGAIFGLGFPPFTGGPFMLVDQLGAAEVVKRIERLAETHGDRFQPAQILKDQCRVGRTLPEVGVCLIVLDDEAAVCDTIAPRRRTYATRTPIRAMAFVAIAPDMTRVVWLRSWDISLRMSPPSATILASRRAMSPRTSPRSSAISPRSSAISPRSSVPNACISVRVTSWSAGWFGRSCMMVFAVFSPSVCSSPVYISRRSRSLTAMFSFPGDERSVEGAGCGEREPVRRGKTEVRQGYLEVFAIHLEVVDNYLEVLLC